MQLTTMINPTSIRAAATAGITALAVIAQYYPHQIWIAATIAALGATGIHAIPSVSQTSTKGSTMSDGLTLMGIVKPVAEPQPQPEAPQAAPEATQPVTPVGAPEEHTGERTAPVDAPASTLPTPAQLRALADHLENS